MISARDLAAQVRGGATAETATLAALQGIEQQRDLGAFLHVDRELALAQAQAVDRRRAAGEKLGPLAGVPVAVKDLLATRDSPTTCASKILTRDGRLETAWKPPYDATVIERLRAADAILIGKTNLDEFAMGSSNENSGFFPVHNPWDPARAPGGSSGGSAASVAAGSSCLALGTDTGGSIRQPAAFCGVVGMKPSYGRVSRYGLVAFASSLDVIGPFANDVADAALLFDVIAGPDERDSTCTAQPVTPCFDSESPNASGLRVGIPAEYFQAGLDPEIEGAVRRAADRLAEAGASLVPVSLPHTRYGVATYYLIATAEASSNLARFDGVRFGMRVEPPGSDLSQLYAKSRGQGFGREVKRRIMLGTYALSAGYYDAYYRRAQLARALISRDFQAVFAQVDVLLTPVSPTPAFKLGEKTDDPLTMYLADVYTLPASLAGLPAISLPCGFTTGSEISPPLPVGCQLIANAMQEPLLFRTARALESLLADLQTNQCPARQRSPLASLQQSALRPGAEVANGFGG
ncbi:MAG: Asp-tRNA(Asn)/Glu-tRNA(Gln) amidotransferase subunit GatA [Polyangiaceae bacterium]|nr:Asp-tRNA(Asn)/Glu-tRNA(Gln) amidotransferase subunit GatA [Polyangiaceae bacterium]